MKLQARVDDQTKAPCAFFRGAYLNHTALKKKKRRSFLRGVGAWGEIEGEGKYERKGGLGLVN